MKADADSRIATPAGPREAATDYPAGYRAARQGAALFERAGSTLVEVTGSERLPYLNSLCTNKLIDLEPGRSARAFLLVPTKGRVLADFLACETGTATWLECQGGCAPTVMDLLGKYYFGQDVAFHDRTDAWRVVALVGPDAGRILTGILPDVPPAEEGTHEESTLGGAPARALRWSDAGPEGWHLWVSAEAFDTARQAILAAGAVSGSEDTWTILQIESGIAAFGRELGEDVIPLEAPTGSAIHHDKGCYPGQEVITRLHFRGRPARQLRGLRIEGEGPPPGAALHAADKPAVAVVTASAVSPALGPVALAYVHRDYCQPGTRLWFPPSGSHSSGATATVVDLPILPPDSE
ncbi:MAG TPA: glycine cleavage T C-terminal barrel domain-containing protein [Gemmatimonadota bacterium]|nr:glycine cleavage T C-terminal barrel domain-containing protein [Gemmatimonadota bacterium]